MSLLWEYIGHQFDIYSLKNTCESLRCSISERKVIDLMCKILFAIFCFILDGYV